MAGAGAGPGWFSLTWHSELHLPGIFDVAGPLSSGRLVLAASDGLYLLDPAGGLLPYARGPQGYPGPGGAEAYMAVSPGLSVEGAGCSFAPDEVYVLRVTRPFGVLRIDASGKLHDFAAVPEVDGLSGLVFDTTGGFGHRLLVTGPRGRTTSVLALDCSGKSRLVSDSAPVLEGGLAVAPAGFGRFGGQLIAPDEMSGRLVAISPRGESTVLATSGLPTGGDIGVESVGFVPPGFSRGGRAYLADRGTPNNPHPGTDSLLWLEASQLLQAGVREGDLLAATEGGALTIDVRCEQTCSTSLLAKGPSTAHGEGHLLLVPGSPGPSPSALPPVADLGAATRAERTRLVVLSGLVAGAALVILALVTLTLVRWLRRR